MKKRFLIAGIILILAVSAIVLYKNYMDKQIQNYVNWISYKIPPAIANGLTGKVTVESIIKRSPTELVMLIKWGDDEAYVSIKNWLTRAHDNIKIRAFDKKKWITVYE